MTNSVRSISFRCDVLKNNITYLSVPVSDGRLDCQKDAQIHRTASIMVSNTDGVDLLRDRFRLLMEIKNGDFSSEHSLGVFVLLSHSKNLSRNINNETLELYDLCAILKEDHITKRLYYPAGTLYTDAVSEIIVSAGLTAEITESSAVFAFEREFEIGTSKLAIINALLDEINYCSAYADENGIIVIKPYEYPKLSENSHIFKTDKSGIICGDIVESADYYNAPNVFIAAVSNPDTDEELTATYINNNPANKLSVSYRHRKIVRKLDCPDGICSQQALDSYVRRKAFEMSQIEQSITVPTSNQPGHGVGDTVFLLTDEIKAVFEEQAWSMNFSAGGEMTHELRRVINFE